MQNSRLKERLARFGSLQAAYRALAPSVHPSMLAPVREQSQRFLMELKEVSARAESGPEFDANDAFLSIDSALDEQAESTRQILSTMEMSQLRATIPALSSTHPGEVGGLVDVLIAGDLDDDKTLRTLEYLVTMLCAEERGGRRIVTKDPATVTDQLRVLSDQKLQAGRIEALEAERVLEAATSRALQSEVGDTRRIREFKRELGSELFHPRVLSAAVAYNVAMWNKVAVEIDTSRAMEQLADELFEQSTQPKRAPRRSTDVDVLASSEFGRLMTAFRARVGGESCPDEPARALAATIPLEILRVEDVEVMESDPEEESVYLMQAAVVLGGLLTKRKEAERAASVLGLDLASIETHVLGELIRRMTDKARKCFANSDYQEAFRLADIKTHKLTAHAAARGEATRPGTEFLRSSDTVAPSVVWSSAFRIVPWLVLLVVVVGLFGLVSFGGSETERNAAQQQALISPFLSSQPPSNTGGGQRTAWLNRAWDYLGTEQRRVVAMEIGSVFSPKGRGRVVLMDAGNRVAAIYAGGELVELVPLQPGA